MVMKNKIIIIFKLVLVVILSLAWFILINDFPIIQGVYAIYFLGVILLVILAIIIYLLCSIKKIPLDGTNKFMKKEKREEFKVSEKELEGEVRKFIKDGNAQKIIIENEKGESIIEIPLAVGTVEAVFIPVLAAVTAIAAIPSNYIIVVVKK